MDRQSGSHLGSSAAKIGGLYDRCQTRGQTEYEGSVVRPTWGKGRLRSSGGALEILRIRVSRHVDLSGGGINGDPGSRVGSGSPGVSGPDDRRQPRVQSGHENVESPSSRGRLRAAV